MELDYKLNRNQKLNIDAFAKRMGDQSSWVLSREEGTGLNFWRIKWTNYPEWAGELHARDGKTLLEAINLVLLTR